MANLKAWRQVVTPHADIRQGKFDSSVFAADLGEVLAGRGAVDYRDAKTFFSKTYLKLLPATNLDLYRFTLEKGFLSKHAGEHLTRLQKAGRLEIRDPATGGPVKKGAFYLSWKNCKEASVQAVFRLED